MVMVCALDALNAIAFVPANTALIEWEPIPSASLMLAFPLLVSCACPKSADPWQDEAVALQNFTSPGTTEIPPEFTVADRVIAAGHAAVVADAVNVVVLPG